MGSRFFSAVVYLAGLAVAGNAQAVPASIEVECVAITRQGYSNEEKARTNPNAASGKIERTNLGVRLESRATARITLRPEVQTSISDDSVSYFGEVAQGMEIGNGIFLHVMVSTDDINSIPLRNGKGWKKAHLFAEVFRRHPNGTKTVVTSPTSVDKEEFWTPGLALSAALLGTEPRTALYNSPDHSPLTSDAWIRAGLAPEGFQISTRLECTRRL